MEFQTKDYLWYYDTPEQRFEYKPESIWLINPKTVKWALELQKGGKLWWYWDFHFNFERYFNMNHSDFEKFIKLWVEDVINRGVTTTVEWMAYRSVAVEDVINRGVSTTENLQSGGHPAIEDAINRGVTTTGCQAFPKHHRIEDVLNRGVSTTKSFDDIKLIFNTA